MPEIIREPINHAVMMVRVVMNAGKFIRKKNDDK